MDSPTWSALQWRGFIATNRLRFRPMGPVVLGVVGHRWWPLEGCVLRTAVYGVRTVASAEQPNRRGATSFLRWVLLDFLRGCFFVPLSPFEIASISLWYPYTTFGWGHNKDNGKCVFYVQRAIWRRSNGMCLSPTTFYNQIGPPRRACSS